MAQVQISLNGFSTKTVYASNTYYNPTQSFSVPENDGISSAVLTFTTDITSGVFADRSAQFNTLRANSGWLSSGDSLDSSLLSAGSNSFRLTFKAGSSFAMWGISNVVLTIDYTPKSDPDPDPYLPTVSNFRVDGSATEVWRDENVDVTLSWDATQGSSGSIYRYDGAHNDDGGATVWSINTTNKSIVMKSPPAGSSRKFMIWAKAAGGDSPIISSPFVHSYSSVKAPTSLVASPSTVLPGSSFNLSWSGAQNGKGTEITKYIVALNGAYVTETTGTSVVLISGGVGSYPYKVYAVASIAGYESGWSPTATLTVFANPSLVSPNKWSMAPLESVKSTLTVYNNAHTHNITYSFHGSTASHNLAAGVNTHDFTFPEAWLASRKTSATGSLVITVSTYSGATLIGTKAITITINIPSSYGPTIGTLTATLVKNGGPESIDRYIKGISKATLEAGAFVYQYGAYSVGFSITGGGYSTGSNPDTFGVFPTAGTITFTAAVLDSRGFTTSKQVSIIVQEYSSPTLSGVAMFRCDEFGTADSAGEYVSLKATSVFASIDGQNTATLQGRVYMRGGTPGAWSDMTSGTVLLLGGGLLSVAKTYISEIKITDKIGNYAISVIIPTDSGVGLHIIDGSLGAAIGKYAEREKFFEIPDDWGTNIGHPVGSVYMSADATSPATLFGGTWAAIGAGTFLVAAGTDYEAGSTGGSATHTLREKSFLKYQMIGERISVIRSARST